MKIIKGAFVAFSALLGVAASTAAAQDNHYWNNQYGTRSALMGGAVVGGVRDTSAIYYNPGALGFIDNPSLSVSANAYKFENLDLDDGAGPGLDVDSETVSVVPLIISGVHKFADSPNHVLGYSILTRNSSDISISARRDDVSIDALSNPFAPGPEEYIGQLNLNSQLDEYWGGLGYAYKVNDAFSVGFTNFLALRDQQQNESISARAVNPLVPDLTAITDASSLIDYQNLRILWKAGMAANLAPVKLGFSVTTPSVDLWSDGTVARDLTVSNVDFFGTGFPTGFIANDRQESLDADYKTPASIAAGLEWEMAEGSNLGISAEWFDKEGRYTVIAPASKDFLRPSGIGLDIDSADFLKVTDEKDSVMNYGVGFEQRITEKFKGIVSFRTDFESFQPSSDDDSGLTLSNSRWDLFHATLGGIWKGENSDLGAGLTWSFGDEDNLSQLVNFTEPREDNFLVGDAGRSKAKYNSVGVIFGYTYYID